MNADSQGMIGGGLDRSDLRRVGDIFAATLEKRGRERNAMAPRFGMRGGDA